MHAAAGRGVDLSQAGAAILPPRPICLSHGHRAPGTRAVR